MRAHHEVLARELLADDSSAQSGEEIRSRMEAAFTDCALHSRPVSALFVEVTRPDRRAAELGIQPADVRRAVVESLRRKVRGGDIFVCEEDTGMLVLLPNTEPEAADLMGRELIVDAKKLTLAGAPRPLRMGLSIGFARSSGTDGLLFETLVLVAREGASVARRRGGECCVHTMLYEVMQGRAEKLALASGKSLPVPPPQAAPVRPDDPPERTNGREPAGQKEGGKARPVPAAQEIEILKRRIEKLNRALEASEQNLAKLSAQKGVVPGIASTYREVQGLSLEEPDRERKEAILREIFAANLELKRLRTREALTPELVPSVH